MINLSNLLSFLRAPLALVFLQENIYLRVLAIFLAMLTDGVDGYLARKNKSVTKFGAILDPVMDKFFVSFLLFIFLKEGSLQIWQAFSLLSRDFFLLLFGLMVLMRKNWKTIKIKPVSWGKITTALQFFLLVGLSLKISISWHVYVSFIFFGGLAFLELIQKRGEKISTV